MAQLQATGITGSLVTTGNITTTGGVNAAFIARAANSSSPQYVLGNAAGTNHWALFETLGAAGQQDNLSFFNFTNSSVPFSITSGGNVGISTTSPKQRLDVAGAGGKIAITNTGTTDYSELMFYEGATVKADIWVNGSAQTDYAGANSMNIWQGSNAPMAFYTNGTNERMRITSGGNVGIGTTVPTGRLTVLAEQSNTPSLLFKNEVGGPGSAISNYVSSAQTFTMFGTNLFITSIATFNRFDATRASCGVILDEGNLIIATGGTGGVASSRLVVNASGNVGIGTNNPIYPLVISNRGPSTGERQLAIGNTATGGTFLFLGTSATTSGYGIIQNISVEGTSFGNLALQPGGANVGIGTTSPNARLDLGGGYGASGEKFFIYNDNSSSALAGTKVGFYMDRFSLSNNSTFVFPTDTVGNPGSYIIASKDTSGTTLVARMTVLGQTGNVGIGTVSPQNLLEVFTGASSRGIQVLGSSSPFVQVQATNNPVVIRMTADDAGGYLQVATNHLLAFMTNNTERMRITSGGNVGIGTITPLSTLDIGKSNATPSLVIGNSAYLSSYNSVWGLQGGAQSIMIFGNNGQNEIRAGNTAAGGYLDFYTNNTAAFTAASNGNFVMRLAANGNVGIGTTNPAFKLDVAGNAKIGDNTTQQTFAALQVSNGQSSATTFRDIDLKGSWAANEGHAITANHSTNVNNIVGQMVFEHNSPGSRIKFGRIYDGGDQSTFPFHMVSNGSAGNLGINTSTPTADLHIDSGVAGATAYAFRTDAVSLDYALYVSASGNVGIGGLVPAAQLNHKLVVFSGSIALRGPNDAAFSYRLNDTAGTNRNALYVSSSNYLNVGNAAFAGLQLFHTGSAPGANNIDNGASRYYGTDQTYYLAEPDKWLAVRINSVNYVMPLYQV